MAAPPPSASARLFGTVELLEGIVLHLLPVEIICLRRTSVFFKNTIDHSISVRKLLFLHHTADLQEKFWLRPLHGSDVVTIPMPIFDRAIMKTSEKFKKYKIVGRRYVFNPLLFCAALSSSNLLNSQWCISLEFLFPPQHWEGKNGRKYATSPDFCGKMFISKPATTKVVLLFRQRGKAGHLDVKNEEGVRYEDLLGAMREYGRYGSVSLLPDDGCIFVSDRQRAGVEY